MNFPLFLIRAKGTYSVHHSTRRNPPDVFPVFFNNTQFSSSSKLHILGIFLTKDLTNISYIFMAKSTFAKLSVLHHELHRISSSQMQIIKILSAPCRKYLSHAWGDSTQEALFNRIELEAFRLIRRLFLITAFHLLTIGSHSVALMCVFCSYVHDNCSSKRQLYASTPFEISVHMTFDLSLLMRCPNVLCMS